MAILLNLVKKVYIETIMPIDIRQSRVHNSRNNGGTVNMSHQIRPNCSFSLRNNEANERTSGRRRRHSAMRWGSSG